MRRLILWDSIDGNKGLKSGDSFYERRLYRYFYTSCCEFFFAVKSDDKEETDAHAEKMDRWIISKISERERNTCSQKETQTTIQASEQTEIRREDGCTPCDIQSKDNVLNKKLSFHHDTGLSPAIRLLLQLMQLSLFEVGTKTILSTFSCKSVYSPLIPRFVCVWWQPPRSRDQKQVTSDLGAAINLCLVEAGATRGLLSAGGWSWLPQ